MENFRTKKLYRVTGVVGVLSYVLIMGIYVLLTIDLW